MKKGGLLYNLPKFAVENPLVMIAVFLALFIGGYISFRKLPVELQPYVESPVVGVIINFPGVSAEDMETYFSRPIEQKMSVINDVLWIRSHSQEGRSEVAIGFDYFTDIQAKKTEVSTLLSNMLNELPLDKDNTTNPWVVHIDAQNVPILDLFIERPGWDEIRLREFVDNLMRDRFEMIQGVQSAIPYGGKRRLVLIEVDRNKLAAYNFSILDVKRAIDDTNLSRSGGRLVQENRDILVRVDHRIEDPFYLKNIPVGNFKDRIIYVKDVAEVKDTHAEVRGAYHFNGKPGILLTMVKQPEVGDPSVIDPSLELAEEFMQEFPGLKISVAYNRADFVWTIVNNSIKELILAFLLTALILLFFLGTWTPTVIVLLSLPAAVLMSFLLYKWPFALTLNTPTNMGLVFVIGRLVDDAVVMMEVISRHVKMGKVPKQAAIDGAQELVFATVATSVTFWIVVGPNLFLRGAMGTGFLGMTGPMIFANMFSTFLALTLVPMMAAYTFRPYTERFRNPLDRFVTWLTRPFGRLVDAAEFVYGHALRLALNHRLIVFAIAGLAIYVGLRLYPALGFEMMPLQDTNQAVGELEAWPGTSFAKTEKIASKVEEILLRQPEIVLVSTQIGQEPPLGATPNYTYFSGYGVRSANKAFFKITLTDKGERVYQFYDKWWEQLTGQQLNKTGRDIWDLMDNVQRQVMETVPGIRAFYLMEMGAAPVNTARAPVEAVFRGNDLETLDQIGREALRIAERTPGLYQPFTSWVMAQPQYRVHVDLQRCRELGVSVKDVHMQAFYAHQGGFTSEFFKPQGGLRHSRYLIRYKPDQRYSLEDLEQTLITTPDGRKIPLKELCTIEYKPGVDLIYKEDLQYALSVLGQYRELGLKQTTVGIVMGSRMSMSMPKGYTVGPKGMMLEGVDNLNRVTTGFYIALFFAFILLLLQSRSFSATLAILVDIPLEIIGAMWFIYFRGMFWSPPVMWGITILTAIVTATGIYLVDKIRQLREDEGMSLYDAVVTAGPIRLRPVMMTTITTVAAFVPPMFAPPTGMDRFIPITSAIIGGMVSSTLLSLIVVPVFYASLEEVREFLKKIYSPEAPLAAGMATGAAPSGGDR